MNNSKTTAIRFKVVLSFVRNDEHDGYQGHFVSNAATKEEAVVEVLSKCLNEHYPLRGIDVYELVLNL